ncbi:hypothetical protein [Rhodovulum sp. 12E13]|nr:hypothetical protein [Rhodovulum sp. 12E13]
MTLVLVLTAHLSVMSKPAEMPDQLWVQACRFFAQWDGVECVEAHRA